MAQLAEPVVRPRGMLPHRVLLVRRARLYTDGQTLVLRDQRLRERRYETGPGGIRRAVLVPPQGDLWEVVARRPAERWGTLVFRGDGDRDVLSVPLAEWLPEGSAVGVAELSPSECLSRTGLRAVVKTLGIPLEEKPHGSQNAIGAVRPSDRGAVRPVRAGHADLPHWHGWARGAGLFAWFVGLVVGFAADSDWALTMAAFGLFLIPSVDGVLRAQGWWRSRTDVAEPSVVEIRPRPAAGTQTTRRFLRTAVVRVTPGEVVLTNTIGEERRLGRTGPHGVTGLVNLVAPKIGERLGVEFRDGAGRARALLPHRYWFAGPGGSERLAALTAALGVTAVDEDVRNAPDGDVWWRGHPLAADARRMSPMEAEAARKETDWHRSVIGGKELIVVPFLALVLLTGLFGHTVPVFLAGLLSALTVVAVLGPALVGSLISRLSLDTVRQSTLESSTHRAEEPESL
ncbi:hypothetical protein [Streptomyces fumanus]|uniref:hypothetical protein n=1 Tax=Streptomyces fumanus TaxID=67302 RepID=UPI0033FF29FB